MHGPTEIRGSRPSITSISSQIMWVAGPDPEVEKQKQNSDHIMTFLKAWDLDLPNM
jgi:hypothetical protein